jgi:uncharacterized iron-regulated protein
MFKTLISAVTLGSLILIGCFSTSSADPFQFFDLQADQKITRAKVVERLQASRIVLVGEFHTTRLHHQAQLDVIKMLHQSGTPVAIGMEMFRNDSQADLDRWTSGELSEDKFQPIFHDNWNYGWQFYRDILMYARNQRIPVIGLNVPREITRQVAREGFQSLSAEQKAALSDITCRVDAEYMAYIRRAFGSHAHGDLDFINFCEAQLVWDNAMTTHALAYLKNQPDVVMVILAGTGHVRKQAIPTQVLKREALPMTVILPEVPGHIERGRVDHDDADYLVHRP